jgi:hypothetical protein
MRKDWCVLTVIANVKIVFFIALNALNSTFVVLAKRKRSIISIKYVKI